MSLPVLVGVVAFGIALVVYLVHINGGSVRLVMADEVEARALFAADHEDADVLRVILTADGHDAVVVLADGGTGLVHGMGSKAVTRRLPGSDGLDATEGGDDTSVAIRFHDVAMADLHLKFADRAARDAAIAAIGRRTAKGSPIALEIA